MNSQDKSELELLRLEMRNEFRVLRTELAAPLQALNDAKKDHEVRLRGLEKWKWAIPPAIIGALALAAAAAAKG